MLTLVLVLSVTALAVGQSDMPGPPSQTPIGGLEILTALGGGYAVKNFVTKNNAFQIRITFRILIDNRITVFFNLKANKYKRGFRLI